MSAKKITRAVYQCKCDREPCGHEWETRGDTLPVTCPKCKGANWNKGKEKKK
jgi:Zn finger protein HypA/HybF involved in hydrogenase expression